jgi:peptidoglycan/LPS O-acetylase OafA/YrhL
MRIHFISRLALLLVGAFLVVASQEAIWVGDTLKWMFIGGGAVAIVFALADSIDDNLAQRGLDALTVLIGAWMVVEVLVLNRPDIKWWSFGVAAALAGISAIGLAVHEMTTERVVHELTVSHAPEQAEQLRPTAATGH